MEFYEGIFGISEKARYLLIPEKFFLFYNIENKSFFYCFKEEDLNKLEERIKNLEEISFLFNTEKLIFKEKRKIKADKKQIDYFEYYMKNYYLSEKLCEDLFYFLLDLDFKVNLFSNISEN